MSLTQLAKFWNDDELYRDCGMGRDGNAREPSSRQVDIQIENVPAILNRYEGGWIFTPPVVHIKATIDGIEVKWTGSLKEMLSAFHKAAYDSGVEEANDCWKYGA